MSEKDDPYWRLRPPAPTPADEICSCTDAHPIVLNAALSQNPIYCVSCNRELPPERVGFSTEEAQGLDYCRAFYNAFFFLWLDCDEFEAWAKAQLSDPNSRVNTLAFEVVSDLNNYRPTFLWWFQDDGAEDFEPLSRCPRCGASLAECWDYLCCKACSILVSN